MKNSFAENARYISVKFQSNFSRTSLNPSQFNVSRLLHKFLVARRCMLNGKSRVLQSVY